MALDISKPRLIFSQPPSVHHYLVAEGRRELRSRFVKYQVEKIEEDKIGKRNLRVTKRRDRQVIGPAAAAAVVRRDSRGKSWRARKAGVTSLERTPR